MCSGWGPKGRWFKSSRPDFYLVIAIFRYFAVPSVRCHASSRLRHYHNLKAQPNISIEVGAGAIDVIASEATGEARERLYRTQAERFPQLVEFEQKADRVIPVIILTPREDAERPWRRR